MRVLVTGTSGRIGRAIAAALESKHDVVGFDRVPGPATSVCADIGDATAINSALEGVQAVIHTAALHAPHVDIETDNAFQRINVDATTQLGQLARENGVTRFVFTSTTALYGSASQQEGVAAWIDEMTEPQPKTIYHRTKLAAEQALEAMAKPEFPVSVIRMSRCFPEPASLMAVYRLHRGVDARDVATTHCLALENDNPGFQRLIVSGATPFERKDVQMLKTRADELIKQCCPALAATYDEQGWALPQSIDRVYDSALAQQVLNWQPVFGWQSVIRQFEEGSQEVLAS